MTKVGTGASIGLSLEKALVQQYPASAMGLQVRLGRWDWHDHPDMSGVLIFHVGMGCQKLSAGAKSDESKTGDGLGKSRTLGQKFTAKTKVAKTTLCHGL